MAIELKVILLIALVVLVIALWQFLKSQKLQKKCREYELQNQELHQQCLEFAKKNQETQKQRLEFEAQNQALQQKNLDIEAQNQELQQKLNQFQQAKETREQEVEPEPMQAVTDNYPPELVKQWAAGDLSFFKTLTITTQWLDETAPVVEAVLGAGSFVDILIKVCTDSSRQMKAQRPVILRYLIDRDKLDLELRTVVALLNFTLDIDNPQNQALELEAFTLLKNKGAKLLKSYLRTITASPPRKISSLNSVYITEYIYQV